MVTSTEQSEQQASNIAVIDTSMGLSGPETIRNNFWLAVGPEKKAVIVMGAVAGTVHENLLPLIREATQKGVSVFVLSTNYGSGKGIQELSYDSHTKLVDTGAILLKNVNVNQAKEAAETIQAEIDQGKTGQQLNEAVIEKFGTPTFPAQNN